MALTPSDRIQLITEIATRLSDAEWHLIDLTLRQFGLPWSDTWTNTDKSAYLVSMTQEAPDESLLDLARHVGFEFGPSASLAPPTFWRQGHFRLFISHLAIHRDFSADLQQQLRPFAMSGFVAHNDIEPTREWQDEILAALASCHAMVALLHPGFHDSFWTDQEIGYAMGRGVLVVTVRLGHDPYGFLARFQALRADDRGPTALARDLFDTLRKHRQTQKAIAEGLVTQLEDAYSFADAKAKMTLLEETLYWDSRLTARARAAVQANRQIRDAIGVPGRLESLITRFGAEGHLPTP